MTGAAGLSPTLETWFAPCVSFRVETDAAFNFKCNAVGSRSPHLLVGLLVREEVLRVGVQKLPANVRVSVPLGKVTHVSENFRHAYGFLRVIPVVEPAATHHGGVEAVAVRMDAEIHGGDVSKKL